MSMDWHVSDTALAHWARGTDGLAAAASVEQHLLACAGCRERLTSLAPRPALPWERLRAVIEVPRPTPVERLLVAIRVPATDARIVTAAHAFRTAWVTGALIVLAFVELASALGPSGGHWAFLAIAPLLPCLAVAASYDPDLEPALEQELAAPFPAERLVLLRTIAVLALVVPLMLVIDLVTPSPAPYVWLLPAAGFVAAVLALSTVVTPLQGATGVATAWLLAIAATALGGHAVESLVHAPFLAGYTVLALACAAVAVSRRHRLRCVRPRRS
jgi:hypothetical protein